MVMHRQADLLAISERSQATPSLHAGELLHRAKPGMSVM